ncbi:MAG TPA: response regulator, partial [Nitrospira sp.]|nr:response regulator [Nitrospira sp.]
MKAKVLIVDDDQDIVTMLQDRLDAGGYKTLTAGDGQRGLELIEQESPNLVLLDLYLPRLKGMDVLKRMAQNKQCEEIPVIVMTAAGTIPDAVEAMRHGAYDFLTKPLEKDHLLIVIQKALERDSLKRQVAALKSDVQNRYATIVGESQKIRGII